MDDSAPATIGRCPCCRQTTDKVETPFYDHEKLTLYFRGERAKLTPILGGLWEILIHYWPRRASNLDLYTVWGLLDVDAKNNLGVNMGKLRDRVAHMGITIENVNSRSKDHLYGGYWPEWGSDKEDVFPYDFGDAPARNSVVNPTGHRRPHKSLDPEG